MRRSTRKTLAKTWGYALFAVLGYGWFAANFGPGVLAVLSAAVVIYCLFQAPVWCCAENRVVGQYCRNNANGILLGCHLRQHRWQKLKMAVRHQYWSQLVTRLLTGIGGVAATLAALASSISAVAAVLLLFTNG